MATRGLSARRARRLHVCRLEQLERRALLDASDYAVRWALDEGVGDATADLAGTVPAATIVTAGWSLDTTNDKGFALAFRGGDRVEIPSSPAFDLTAYPLYTLSLWFKSDATAPPAGDRQVIYSQDDSEGGLDISLSDGRIEVGSWVVPGDTSGWQGAWLRGPAVTAGEWHHLAVVLTGSIADDPTALSAYLDGELMGGTRTTASGPESTVAGGATIGDASPDSRFPDGVAAGGFQGLIDDVRVYHRALTPAEVEDVHHSDLPAEVHHDDDLKLAEHEAVMALVPRLDATSIAVRSGDWSDPQTWADGRVPSTGDDVLIVDGRHVTYDAASDAPIHTVRIDGELDFAVDTSTRLVVDTMVVAPIGVLTIGTAAAPVPADVTAHIDFAQDGPIDTTWDPYLLSRGLISHGRVEIVGAETTPYVALSQPAVAGDTALLLRDVPTNWRVGDTIVLGGTSYNASGSNADNTRFRDEILEITGVVGNRVTFVNRTNAAADGQPSLIWTHAAPAGFDLNVYVANYSRNVRFATQNSSSVPIAQRGHVMFMHNPDVVVRNAEFYQLGRTDKSQLVTDPQVVNGVLVDGGENPRARYAVHFHRTGDNDINSTPAQVSGCSVFGSPGWGYVNHDSHVDMEDNVAFGVVGAAFTTEIGDELGSFRRNLSIKTTGDADPNLTFDGSARVPRFDFGFNGEAFWIQGSPGIVMEDNIAISAAGGGVNVFSGVDGIRTTIFSTSNVRDATLRASLLAAGVTEASVTALPMPQLDGMEVYNSEFGIIFWGHMRQGREGTILFTNVAHPGRTLVQDFRLWNIHGEGIFTQYSGQITFRDGLVLGNVDNPIPYSAGVNGGVRGIGVDSNSATRAMEYENLHVEGFDRAVRVLFDATVPNSVSRLIGGYFAHNRYIFASKNWSGGGLEPFAFRFEVSGDPTFIPLPGTVNQAPLADFSSAAIAGLGLSFDGRASRDPDPPAALSLAGNGIASYRWDFGDGSTASGAQVVHAYAAPGSYDATLTVIDSQGAAQSLTRTVTVTPAADNNPLLNSDFRNASQFQVSFSQDSGQRGVGWVGYRWQLASGYAQVNSGGAGASLIQVIRDESVRTGAHTLRLDLKDTESNGRSNQIYVQVYGVNGLFAFNVDTSAGPGSFGAWPVQVVPLLRTTSLGGSSFNWRTFSWDIDLGPGYEYLVVRIFSADVNAAGGDFVGVRNVTLIPTPTTLPNQAPAVSAGADQTITLPATASLDGSASDDGLPSGTLTTTWTKVSGPGTVSFIDAAAQDTVASFSAAGTYTLRLTASDGVLSRSDDVVITVGSASAGQTVDDGDAGFGTVGSWAPSSLGGFHGESLYSAAGTGADTATWTFNVTPGRNYRVMATWKASGNRASNAPFAILDGSTTLGTVAIDQKVAPNDLTAEGTSWEVLGSYTISGNQLVVRLSDAANGIVVADAIRIEEIAASPSQIIDDGDAGFNVSGVWASSTLGGFQGDSRYKAPGSGNAATWTFAVTPGQTYRVSATWTNYPNRATDAPYTILDGGTALATVRVNQERAPNDFSDAGIWWEDLGRFTVSGATLVVRLTDQANELVVADAIRIEQTQVAEGSISGRVYNDLAGDGISNSGDPGLGGWQVDVLNANGVTVATAHSNNDGSYSLGGLQPGTYTVQEIAQTGWVGTSPSGSSYQINVSAGSSITDLTFGNFKTISAVGLAYKDINGNGTQDPDEPRLIGRTIQLLDSSGAVVSSTTTGADGNYAMTDLGPGTYTLQQIVPTGSVETEPSYPGYQFTTTSGSNLSDLVFGSHESPALAPTAVIDNSSEGYSETGTWITVTGGYLGDNRIAATIDTTASAEWSFAGLTSGSVIDIYITYRYNRVYSNSAPFTVYDGSTPLETVFVDQSVSVNQLQGLVQGSYGGVGWIRIGRYALTTSEVRVTLGSDADGSFVAADGVLVIQRDGIAPLEVEESGSSDTLMELSDTARIDTALSESTEGLQGSQQTAVALAPLNFGVARETSVPGDPASSPILMGALPMVYAKRPPSRLLKVGDSTRLA